MLSVLKATILIFIVSSLSGCASNPKPYAINGKYYMAGDYNCERYSKKLSLIGNYINCFTADGKPTGHRKAMSDKELQNYIDEATQPTYFPIFIPTYTPVYY